MIGALNRGRLATNVAAMGGGGASVTYLRDIPGSPATIYSLSRVRQNGRPVGTVLRSTDGASMDIETIPGSRAPDMVAVATFLGSAVGQILLKDQGPGQFDETQATASLRPVYVAMNDTLGVPMVTFLSVTAQTVIPSGFTTDRNAVTMAFVGGVVGNNSMMQAGVNAGTTANAQLHVNNQRACRLANAFSLGARAAPADLGIVLSTPTSVRVNETKTPVAAPNAAAISGGYAGACSFISGTAGGSFGNHACRVMWPTGLAVADEANVYSDLKAIFGIPDFTDQVLFVGDSNYFGQATSSGKSVSRYATTGLSRRCFIANVAISGQTLATISAAGAQTDATYVAGYNNVLVNNAGTNDIENGTSAADLWAIELAYIRARKLRGWKYVRETIPSRRFSVPAKSQVALDFNQLVRANAAAEGYTVADTSADPAMQNPNDTTYYHADGIHFVDAGTAKRASIILPAINLALSA